MAIQIPNPGTGNGASGDNEFVLWSKVKDNFSDQTNAASRLVGESTGNLLEVGTHGVASVSKVITDNTLVSYLRNGFYVKSNAGIISYGQQYASGFKGVLELPTGDSNLAHTQITVFHSDWNGKSIDDPTMASKKFVVKLYTDRNTTKDAGTGFLKVSSPVLHVYNDKIDKIHEAEQLDITVDKKAVGHYEIHGTTGLRKNDGWNISPPRDIHGNVRCMIEVTEKDGVITVKTYKRKFDLELAAIVHDYDNPLDIPDGACVELRFNDLPQEKLDDIQPEEVDLDK